MPEKKFVAHAAIYISLGAVDYVLSYFPHGLVCEILLVQSGPEKPQFDRFDCTPLQEHPKKSCCTCGNLNISWSCPLCIFPKKSGPGLLELVRVILLVLNFLGLIAVTKI